ARRHARLLSLSTLDAVSARSLLVNLGVHGDDANVDQAAAAAGLHAKAVELLGTYLVRFHRADARGHRHLPQLALADASAEELHVARVRAAFRQSLSAELQDILALATAFRQPPAERRLLQYLISVPVHHLLHDTRRRDYVPFAQRTVGWLEAHLNELVEL